MKEVPHPWVVEDEDALDQDDVARQDDVELVGHPRVGLEVVDGDPGGTAPRDVLGQKVWL